MSESTPTKECVICGRMFERTGVFDNSNWNRRKYCSKKCGNGHYLYQIWKAMRRRCNNQNVPEYERYGGRGIKVCERWSKFRNFIADMGKRPTSKHQIDRIDNNGNYEPSNCRWATATEQACNRRSNVLVTIDGRTQTRKQWSEHFGISYATVQSRLAAGLSEEEALTTPTATKYRSVSYNGKTQSLKDWSKELGLPYVTLHKRISQYNWPAEKAFTTPGKFDGRNLKRGVEL